MTAILKLVHETDLPEKMGRRYNEYPQGYSFEMSRVWELVEDNTVPSRFFRQTGHGDSYGEITWNDDEMFEVKPTTKTVTVYDYTEV